ncbi:MAG: nicotinate-nucleotide adenylyltransferase [Deltaproteobacteria bacterium]|nr:nicotinate-nucleotide adenylyltransferase [Deltaproteobacteria bacterium]
MKIGLLGGTFNPIHIAHLRIAEEVREVCALERVLFIPAAVPPHKEPAGGVSFEHRCTMTRLAVEGNPAFSVSDLEGRRNGKSYSVDTLAQLRGDYPQGEFFFILGMDSFLELETWKEYPRLFELAHLVVVGRPGFHCRTDSPERLPIAVRSQFCYDGTPRKLRHLSGNTLVFLQETMLDIASTRIRDLLSRQRSIRYLVPDAVTAYIRTHGLYATRR